MLLVSVFTILFFVMTDRGVFESEPVGVEELRREKEEGNKQWLPNQVAWLKINGTHIDYPVVQGNNNTFYLSHDYYDNESASGAVFLDFRNNADFSDDISIIYGHRMNGDLMFSDVAKFRDSTFLTAHTEGELETKNGKYSLRVIEYRTVNSEDELYRKLVLDDFDEPAIVLSTCDRNNHNVRDLLLLAFDNRGKLW
ncbi:MAG: class B sortase [Candidatus Saccharibacteria bacterium]|nr:class B sortase [Candidatus Saccharibacteria bacterium]